MDTAPLPDADSPAGKGKALVDDTAAAIRARILSGEIPIGAQLRQVELAEMLGVSRTPVREALRQLQAGGLIEVLPNRGAVVRVPAPWEVREAYEIRAELEGLACVRAVHAVTPDVLRELREANETVRAVSRGVRDVSGGPAPGEGSSPASSPSASPSTSANDCFHTLIHTVAATGGSPAPSRTSTRPSRVTSPPSSSRTTPAIARTTSVNTSGSSRLSPRRTRSGHAVR